MGEEEEMSSKQQMERKAITKVESNAELMRQLGATIPKTAPYRGQYDV